MVEKLFKAGHFAKALIYFVMGSLAVATVAGVSSTTGAKGVIKFLNEQTFGSIILIVLGVGLVAYCLWRWYKGLANPGHEDGTEGIIKRISYAVSGTFYGLLAFYTFKLALGESSGNSNQQETVLANILDLPAGKWIVGALGLIMLGTGIYQLVKGIKEKYMEEIATGSLSAERREYIEHLGKLGHIVRAVVFGIIAYFLFMVALQSDASEFRSTEGALEFLQNSTYGTILVLIAGLGMICYAVFAVAKAQYGKLR